MKKGGKELGKGKKGWERGKKRWKTGKKRSRKGEKGWDTGKKGWERGKRVGKRGSAPKPALERTRRLQRDGSSSGSGSGRELGMAQGEFIQGIVAPAPGEGREEPGSGRDRSRDRWNIRPESRERLEGTRKGSKVGALGMLPRDSLGKCPGKGWDLPSWNSLPGVGTSPGSPHLGIFPVDAKRARNPGQESTKSQVINPHKLGEESTKTRK